MLDPIEIAIPLFGWQTVTYPKWNLPEGWRKLPLGGSYTLGVLRKAPFGGLLVRVFLLGEYLPHRIPMPKGGVGMFIIWLYTLMDKLSVWYYEGSMLRLLGVMAREGDVRIQEGSFFLWGP